MPKTETNNRIPGPLYAAAGAGDIAIENLRKLPAMVAELQGEIPGRITKIQDRITQKVAELPSFAAELRQRVVDADTDKLRESARRNAQVVLGRAQSAQKKGVKLYAELVARGEQVVGRSMPGSRPEKVRAEVLASSNGHHKAEESEVLDGELTGKPSATAAKRPTRTRKS
jgi:hypothetical protein